MSRETDSSSSGPKGHGGAAYPSGTPPYGTGQYPSTDAAATAPEENAVTAKPSTPDADGPRTETTLTTRIRINIPGSRPIPPVVVRKAMGNGSGSAGAGEQSGPEATPGQASPPPLAQRRGPQPTRIEAAPEPAGAPEPAPAPAAEAEEPASNWFAPRKPAAPAPAPAPAPAAAQMPPAATAPPLAQRPLPTRTPSPTPTPTPTPPAMPGGGFPPPQRTQAPPVPGPDAAFAPPRTPPPPVTDYGQGFAPAPAAPMPGGPGVGTTQGFPAYGGDQGDTGPVTEAFPAYGGGPAGPTGGPGFGSGPVGGPAGAAAFDEAPQWPGPDLDGPLPTPVPTPAPAAPRPAAAQPKATTDKPAKKGRSKLVLLGGGVIALIGLAYGGGLLLNHSDVPKGTTVLDVDISGSRDEAVSKLQTAFGTRAAAPIQLSVGGKTVELKPEKAGLTLDAQTTVRNAAGSDYNPITVIGSLLGNERVADPVMPIDEEKLQVALQELAGTSGTATEGTIKFDTGKAVAVPGTPGTTLDVDASVQLVAKAFKDQVATGKAAVAELPTTTKAPAVGQAELDRAMKEFAEPAMSANATVKVGTKSIAFGARSLPKILSMQPVDGRLTEKFDLEALKATYGNTFDGILITRGNGEKTAVTPQDIAGALGKALRGKTTAERTVVVDTNPS
ncbi:peptidoglycan binding domain-containing protein [Streptomyces sp. NBC_01207]|uniref:peptidoglycan binding domain-containing protein n=1 Tax=Streptomyces sp. NBC_01207 TaxID=2903772 RepID=UPI003FA356D1|nr:peptidoglycan binding domain-containing protein [Streptomyces sp. NBC_01207]